MSLGQPNYCAVCGLDKMFLDEGVCEECRWEQSQRKNVVPIRDVTRPGPDLKDEEIYQLEPLDWQRLIANGIPPIDYLDDYLIRQARTWIWGPTGTSKSIYALWLACKLTRSGHRVAYFSEENPTTEDLRRLGLLAPDPEHLLFFHRTGIDLTDPAWVRVMLDVTAGCEVVAFDTWTDCWHGDENSNEDVRNFDADVLKPLQAQGATPLVVHHTGHPVMFANRKGANAGRGASSLGQKADVTLEFRAEEHRQFTIVYGKARVGGERQPDRTFEVIDTDEGIDIVEIASRADRAVVELVEKMVQAIGTAPAGYLTQSQLRTACGGNHDTQRDALERLAGDSRVQMAVEKVPDKKGRPHDAKVWRPAEDRLL